MSYRTVHKSVALEVSTSVNFLPAVGFCPGHTHVSFRDQTFAARVRFGARRNPPGRRNRPGLPTGARDDTLIANTNVSFRHFSGGMVARPPKSYRCPAKNLNRIFAVRHATPNRVFDFECSVEFRLKCRSHDPTSDETYQYV